MIIWIFKVVTSAKKELVEKKRGGVRKYGCKVGIDPNEFWAYSTSTAYSKTESSILLLQKP